MITIHDRLYMTLYEKDITELYICDCASAMNDIRNKYFQFVFFLPLSYVTSKSISVLLI